MSDPLPRLRAAALALAETSERPSHGQPTFFVASRQFAQFRRDHHGDGRTVVCVRAGNVDEQEALIALDPETYSRPAYLGAAGWVSVDLADAVDWALVEHRLERSWTLAAPKRLAGAGR